LKLDIQEEISGILAKIIILLVIILLFTGVLIFASLTLATYLNGLFSSTFIGYAILSGIFLILILIAVPSRKNKKIQQKISQLLNKYFNEKGD
jgi:membrane protein implicated in regulation of membrane protease activity